MKKTYNYTSDMIKEAVNAGFTHVGGRGYFCKACKGLNTLRKFKKDGKVIYACKCGYRR